MWAVLVLIAGVGGGWSHAPPEPHAETDPVVAEFTDFLPFDGMLPFLSPEDVERWTLLAREASRRTREGDPDGAAKAYRAQIAIYGANAEPFVALAILEASRGNDQRALDDLRAAIVRGFTDLSRLERAEGAANLRKSMTALKLEEYLPDLRARESAWPPWERFRADDPPRNLAEALAMHAKLHERVALMAPVLGARQVMLYKRVIDRSTAALLEIYVAKRPDAPDLDDAIARLMAIYAGGAGLSWEVLPVVVAQRLSSTSSIILGRGADHPLRPGALACASVAQNASRDAKGLLRPASAEWIRTALSELLSRYPDSDFAALAVTGLVRTEAETGRMPRAAEAYGSFRTAHADNPVLLDRVRDALGDLALRAGGLPVFEAVALDGSAVSTSGLRGKVVVVDFWATSCAPCVESLTGLRRLGTAYGDRVALVAVSLDEMPVEALRAWIATRTLPGRHVQAPELAETFGVKTIPFRVVAGPDGTVLTLNESGKRLEKTVAAAVGRK